MPLVKVGDSHNLNENESGIHKGFFLTQKPRGDWWSLCGIGDSVDCLWIVDLEDILYLVNKAITVLALLLGLPSARVPGLASQPRLVEGFFPSSFPFEQSEAGFSNQFLTLCPVHLH
jgi:hypothetical protein